MGGVRNLVDAVGGVELCLDMDVFDTLSGLAWTSGCHVSDGMTALSVARWRYGDPEATAFQCAASTTAEWWLVATLRRRGSEQEGRASMVS